MWPFKKKGEVKQVESMPAELGTALRDSFQRVRSDMDNVSSWLNYFYSRDAERQRALENLYSVVNSMSSERRALPDTSELRAVAARLGAAEEKIEQLGVSVHSVEPVISRLNELNSRVNLVEESGRSVFERLKEISARVEKVEQMGYPRAKASANLREKIMRGVARKSKDYIKGVILSAIGKYEQISALQLREMIVEEQGLCSKSTFYRILEEIEAEDAVSMAARGKEKVYFPKILKKH